jgi:hypothetical protein
MKRAAEHTEGPYGRDKLFRRQDPVSCQLYVHFRLMLLRTNWENERAS